MHRLPIHVALILTKIGLGMEEGFVNATKTGEVAEPFVHLGGSVTRPEAHERPRSGQQRAYNNNGDNQISPGEKDEGAAKKKSARYDEVPPIGATTAIKEPGRDEPTVAKRCCTNLKSE